MAAPFTGGCACGAMRYECTAEPLYMDNCHCRDCQRATGSAYFAAVGVSVTAFRLTIGTTRGHRRTRRRRRFNNTLRLRVGYCDAMISSSTSRSRSLPKKISSPTKNVGAPKVPRATEASVFSSSLSFTSCSWLRAKMRAPSRPD